MMFLVASHAILEMPDRILKTFVCVFFSYTSNAVGVKMDTADEKRLGFRNTTKAANNVS